MQASTQRHCTSGRGAAAAAARCPLLAHRAALRCCAQQHPQLQQQHPQHHPQPQQQPGWRQLLQAGRAAAASAALAAALALSPPPALASELAAGSATSPVFDGARVLSEQERSALAAQLEELQQRTGWRVRLFSQYDADAVPGSPGPRQLWGSLDRKTVVVKVDPSAPNILAVPFIGDDVLSHLRRPFWVELQSRFGNLFNVREAGDAAAVSAAMAALIDCLGRPEGCAVVPGLPEDQYFATLWCSVAGGLVAGFVARIEPQGLVRRRWVWVLLFAPLWGSLFVSFGLGPVVTRTSDIVPIAANSAAFLAAAAAPTLVQRLWWDGSGGAARDGGSGGP